MSKQEHMLDLLMKHAEEERKFWSNYEHDDSRNQARVEACAMIWEVACRTKYQLRLGAKEKEENMR